MTDNYAPPGGWTVIWGPVTLKYNHFTKKYKPIYGPPPKPMHKKSLFDIYLERNAPSALEVARN